MKRCAVACLFLSIYSFSFAKPTDYFVGAALEFGIIGQTYPQHVVDDGESAAMRFNSGGGGRLEIGLTRGSRSLYLSFQHLGYKYRDARDAQTSYLTDHRETGHRFQSDRLLLGLRLCSRNPSPVRSLIGISVSGGWAERSRTYDQIAISNGQVIASVHESVVQRSQMAFGLGGELGMLIRTYRNLDTSLVGHLEYINSQIGSRGSGLMEQINQNFYVVLQLGLQYRFRPPFAG